MLLLTTYPLEKMDIFRCEEQYVTCEVNRKSKDRKIGKSKNIGDGNEMPVLTNLTITGKKDHNHILERNCKSISVYYLIEEKVSKL